jgi:hypothetical protein
MKTPTVSTTNRNSNKTPKKPESNNTPETKLLQTISQLSNIGEKELSRKNDDVKRMIDYYNNLTDSVENRRNKIYDFNLQYLAILLTASGVLYSIKDKFADWIWIGVCVLLLTQTFFAALIITLYEIQSKYRYPFLNLPEYGNKWKWFYYGNPFITKIDRDVMFPSSNDENTKIPYLNGLEYFVSNYSKENLGKEFEDNLQQLYLLQVHNYYKNQFYLSLVWFRLISLKISVLGFLIVFVVFYLLHRKLSISEFMIGRLNRNVM